MREYHVLHYVLRSSMSLFIKKFPLYSYTKFWPFSSPKPLVNLVVEVGTRHSHQILLMKRCQASIRKMLTTNLDMSFSSRFLWRPIISNMASLSNDLIKIEDLGGISAPRELWEWLVNIIESIKSNHVEFFCAFLCFLSFGVFCSIHAFVSIFYIITSDRNAVGCQNLSLLYATNRMAVENSVSLEKSIVWQKRWYAITSHLPVT